MDSAQNIQFFIDDAETQDGVGSIRFDLSFLSLNVELNVQHWWLRDVIDRMDQKMLLAVGVISSKNAEVSAAVDNGLIVRTADDITIEDDPFICLILE